VTELGQQQRRARLGTDDADESVDRLIGQLAQQPVVTEGRDREAPTRSDDTGFRTASPRSGSAADVRCPTFRSARRAK
jgi:hypothetical protein